MKKLTVREHLQSARISKSLLKKNALSFIEQFWDWKTGDISKELKVSISKVERYRRLLSKKEPINLFHGNSKKRGMYKLDFYKKIVKDYKQMVTDHNLGRSANTRLTPIVFCRNHPDYDESMRRKVAKALIHFGIYYPRMWRTSKNKIRKAKRYESDIHEFEKSNYYFVKNLTFEKYIESIPVKKKMLLVTSLKNMLIQHYYRIEIDGSIDYYLNTNEKTSLVNVVDYASGNTIATYMTKFENAQGYINVLCDIFDKYGLPAEIRIDRISLLESHVPGSVTQIRAQLEKMGITVIAKSHPTNKPVIENSWNSWQQSLPIFLSINNITTIEAYNQNREKVLEYMNSLNKKTPMIITEKRNLPDDYHGVSIAITRVCRNNIVSISGETFGFYDEKGDRVTAVHGSKISIRISKENQLFTMVGKDKIMLKPINDLILNKKFSDYLIKGSKVFNDNKAKLKIILDNKIKIIKDQR
ncbi:hypothetical protein, partial [Mycoplasma testudineum]|uniref:hypothetical protein n=1 Tax=Mycoplasma testudineum TaxID=244584 RepID=UPI000B9F894F